MTTTKYIITDDKVVDSPSSTQQTGKDMRAFSAYGAYTELAKKLDVAATSAEENYIPKVVKIGTAEPYTYKLQLSAPTSASQADWTEETESAASFILHKPFKTVGTGLKVVSDALTADFSFTFQKFTSVSALPTASEDYKGTIALVPLTTTTTQNIYEEYVCISDGGSPAVWSWEKLGQMDFTLTQAADKITINGTDLQTASASQCGIVSKDDWSTFNGKQAQIAAADTGKTQVVKYTTTAGSVEKLDVESTIAADATNTNLVTNGAVKTALDAKVPYAPSTVSTASTSFMLGKDDDGFFLYEE